MSQAEIGTINPASTSGTALATLLSNFNGAWKTSSSGASAPSYAAQGLLWLDTTTATALALKIYDGSQWITLGTFNGSTHAAPGNRLKRIRSFVASATYTPTDANVKAILVEVVGGGGAGGGAQATTAAQAPPGNGGDAGSYARGFVTSGFSSVVMTIGAGGAGVSGAAGGDGGATSFGTLFSCPGGTGGGAGGLSTSPTFTSPNTGPAVPTIDVTVQQAASAAGSIGDTGINLIISSAGAVLAGAGADSPMGRGGPPQRRNTSGQSAGSNGSGNGAGGGGATSALTGTAVAGGAGAAGRIVVWEFE